MSKTRPEMTPQLRIQIKNILEKKKPCYERMNEMYKLLKENGFTQQYIADESGLSKQIVSHFCKPYLMTPKLDSIILLARSLEFDKSTVTPLI